MKRVAIVLFIILSVFPAFRTYAQSSNAGFVSSNLWYSKDPFEEGDKIKIYTLVFNPDHREFSGTVNFFDKTVFLGKKDFVVPANGVQNIYIDWTATLGDHIIFGKIENAQFLGTDGKLVGVYLSQNETDKSSRTIGKKISTSTSTTPSVDSSLGSIQNIGNLIKEKTPDVIAVPITNTANAIEGLRENLGLQTDTTKADVQKQINALDNSSTVSIKSTNNTKTVTKNSNSTTSVVPDKKINNNTLLKPFKYVELFLLTILSFLLNNKYVFYGTFVLIIFLVLRFIWLRFS